MADLGEIARAVGDEFLRTRRTTPFQRKALRAIQRCRTPAMGGVLAVCDSCGAEHVVFRSCRSRSCPRCQARARAAWLEAREQEVLPVPYFHVVFTVPEVLNPLALYCPEVFYALLLQAAGNTLLDVGLSKLHARLGCLAILHTWGQNLSLHPHVHCVVPGGGFSPDRRRWVGVRKASFLLPVRVLRSRFRSLLCHALRVAAAEGRFERLPSSVVPSAAIRAAAAQRWVVYAKPPFGGPAQVLEYLSRYTHRVAISNRRILSFRNGQVTFEWRDYHDGNRVKQSTIAATEFLRRFLMHVLPDRFVRIRYFGFMANRRRAENIAQARELIGCAEPLTHVDRARPPLLCPACYAASLASRGRRVPRTVPSRPPPVALQLL